MVVVAASPAVRAGLRAMLDVPGIEVVGDVTPGHLTVGSVEVDVVVVESRVGGREDAAELEARFPEAILAILTTGPVPPELLGEDGSRGRVLLSSEASADDLVAAIRAAARGLIVVDPVFATMLRPAQSGRASDGADVLTPRELDVLQAMALGLPNKGIGLRLGISEHTVKFHVGTILAKLAAASRTEAVMTAARAGMLRL